MGVNELFIPSRRERKPSANRPRRFGRSESFRVNEALRWPPPASNEDAQEAILPTARELRDPALSIVRNPEPSGKAHIVWMYHGGEPLSGDQATAPLGERAHHTGSIQMRLLTIASVAALTMFAAPAFAQGTAGSGGGQSAGTSTEPPTKVWVYGQNGWTERNVGEPMKTQMRGQRVARPMIYWQQGGSWYSMPDAAGSNGQMISDQLSQETPSTGGGAATNK